MTGLLLTALLVIFSGPLLFEGACQLEMDMTEAFSTSLIRKLTLSEACRVGPPCHVYATLPENTAEAVLINFHTNVKHTNATICCNSSFSGSEEIANFEDFCVVAHVSCLKGVEWIGQRNMHSAYLSDLMPDTVYRIRIRYDGRLQTEELYQTLPSNLSDRKIRIVMGGDAGYSERAYETGAQAAKYKPDLIVMGGDLAYDNGMVTCFNTWDRFLEIFEHMNRVKGMLIPLIFSIGNHDVGIEPFSIHKIVQDEYGPPFFIYFPQHSAVGANGQLLEEVPSLGQRKSYFHHIVGGTLQVSLDSGYIAEYNGTQLAWLKGLNDKYAALPKFAYYHVPIYWGFGLWDAVAKGIVLGMQHWVPEFDRTHYMSAWENHAHLLKRTKPLRGGIPTENGTMYLGEGCWGVACLSRPLENSTGIFDYYENKKNHFWLVELQTEGVFYKAIDFKGEIVDEAWQRYDNYLIST